MADHFARLLQNQKQVNHFLHTVLQIDRAQFDKKIEYRIITAEKGVIDGLNEPTLSSTEFRDMDYSSSESRLNLRNQIVEELFTLELLEQDDDIRLTVGGAKPPGTKQAQHAYILTGLPASGKSAIAARIAREHSAYILDADFAKRKLPEYDGFPWGASIVHAESKEIIFGEDKGSFQSLFSKVAAQRYNLIIPTIGATQKSVLEFAALLDELGYKVHLTLVDLPKEKATIRALKRFNVSNRYVPLSLIFDVHSENPALIYYRLRVKAPKVFTSFGVISTDVQMGQQPICTDILGENPAGLFEI